MSRDKGAHRVNMILTELERHDGASIVMCGTYADVMRHASGLQDFRF
jgi:hypothetical protein